MQRQTQIMFALALFGAVVFVQQIRASTQSQSQTPVQTKASSQQEAQIGAPKGVVIPPEASQMANPVKPSEQSIAEGKRRYDFECAMCHGANGDGKGKLGASMKLNIPDLRDPATQHSITEGGLYYVISKGHNPMLNEAARNNPTQVWDLVNYFRSLEKKVPQPKAK
jgi:mono/diheme cytochrome c family protein